MALYNANYQALVLPAGSYNTAYLGDGISASCVHQLFCLSAGTINVTANGGGNFNWPATPGQSMDIMVSNCVVSGGTFIGFKTSYQPTTPFRTI